ncbi:hypothetical protein BJY04DRAFT_224575 [Aspergillus karnatakaensis]|uniref:uncharacterized protein n=1 Tax=Aspergillus karnatakaensis TaxID=1810916 RepID=UPI003CCCE586
MTGESQGAAPQSVKEIWDNAIVRFQERTGEKLDGVQKSVEDLQKALDAHCAAQQDAEGVSKAKATGLRILHCIQLLGGVASQAAAVVFSPAGLCFNALSFLLDIPAKVHEFHGEVNAVFDEVGPALAQFRIYQRMDGNTRVDEALRTSIHQVMTSFVDVCASCINIHHAGRWKSFKRSAKRILLDDKSVAEELDRFKKLTQDQLNIQATLTLEVALETNQYVGLIRSTAIEIDETTKVIKTEVFGLAEGERKRTLEDLRKETLSAVRSRIGQKPDQLANMIDARNRMWETSIKGSGKWLHGLDAYQKWIDKDDEDVPLLILSGEAGTGKSYLISFIAQDIKSENSGAKAERSLIGYYSFSMTGKGDSDRQRPETAIKSICAQLAEQSHVYAKHVAIVCGESGKDEKYFRDASCRELWQTLGIAAPAKNTTHFILLDSVSVLKEAELERLVEAIEGGWSNRVRVLLGVEPSTLRVGRFGSVTQECINVTSHNNADIERFIEDELEKAEVFQGSDEDSRRRRKMVQERLTKRSNNCFSTVQQDLRKINDIIATGGTEDELNQVLRESSLNPKDLARSDIEILEATLKPREIEEVAELLTWVVAAAEPLSLDQLAAALYLRFNTVSLQPLKQKVLGKYAKLFELPYGGSYLALREHVWDSVIAHRDRPRESDDDPKIDVTISITNGDVKAVQRFFWDLNHHSFLDGFAFRQGSGLTTTGTRRIQVYNVDAHFEIVKRAFDFFQRPSIDERGRPLGGYLMGLLPFHLKVLYEATGLDELPLTDKQYIASNIYDMFNEEDWIERHWDFRYMTEWYRQQDDMETFWRWLEDPKAIAKLGARDRRWLAEMKEDKHRNRRLLTPLMTVVCRHWLTEPYWQPRWAYRWLEGFLTLGADSKAEELENNDRSRRVDGDDEDVFIYLSDSTVDRVIKAERWATRALNAGQKDHTWFSRLGDTYADIHESQAAVQQYQQTVKILEAQDPIDKAGLQGVYHALGRACPDPDAALEYFKKSYEMDPSNVGVIYTVVSRANCSIEDARAILKSTMTLHGTDAKLLISVLELAVGSAHAGALLALYKALASLFSLSPEYWTVLKDGLETAIQNARAGNFAEDLANTLFLLGTALNHFQNGAHDAMNQAKQLWQESVAVIRQINVHKYWPVLDFTEEQALHFLASFYLEKSISMDPAEREDIARELQEIYESPAALSSMRHLLASFYTLNQQQDKARDLFRDRIISTFHILCDDDMSNDSFGFSTLHEILNHTGDYDNAKRAAFLTPEWRFDNEILHALLAEDEPSLAKATEQLAEFCGREYFRTAHNIKKDDFSKVITELEGLTTAAEPGSSDAVGYTRAYDILKWYRAFVEDAFTCDSCLRTWNYETGLHVCKYCYNTYLCDACLDTLRSEGTCSVLVCSKNHGWWDMEPWTIDSYVRAWKRLVPVSVEDGSEVLISVSQWLGDLCEDWGLSRLDFSFE